MPIDSPNSMRLFSTPIPATRLFCSASKIRGFTLIELLAFLVVISIALVSLINVFNQASINNVDPIIQVRALECAQAKLDEILGRRFDEASPSGGIPACGSADVGAPACVGITADSDFDDVGDYNGQTDTSFANCSVAVVVAVAGGDLGIPAGQARRITVTATSDGGGQVVLSAYRANF